jgi:putative transposase
MPRLPRSVLSDVPVHVVQRGNNRQTVFFTSTDYRKYLEALCIAAEQTACAVHASVLMSNHVHLLLTPGTPISLARLMQSIGRRYVRYVNSTYRRSGTLWEGRFRSTVVDSDRYLMTCMRYIESNPVRAGMVAEPAAYPWSSFRANALGEPDEVVTPHHLYLSLAHEVETRRSSYRQLFQQLAGSETEACAELRGGVETGVPTGDAHFKTRIATELDRRVEKFPHGGARRGEHFRRLSSTLTP